MPPNVRQQSVCRAFGVRAADRHADIRRRHGPLGRRSARCSTSCTRGAPRISSTTGAHPRTRRSGRSAAERWCRSPCRPPWSTCMASGEFCNMRRRVAHLLAMYGFVIYVVATVVMVFALSDARHAHAAMAPGALVYRRADGLPRRLLVLVLHPRRRRRRGQFAVPLRARRYFRRVARAQRDLRPALGLC